MFVDDINREINGVIQVGQKQEEVLVQEMDEYIITKELKKHFITFFNYYSDAFREYFAGNGRAIYVENDRLLERDIGVIVTRMAQDRGVKERVIKTVDSGNGTAARQSGIKKKLKAAGLKKVIIIVPEYAARRFHMMYSRDTGGTLYMIKPLKVSYFQGDSWWRDSLSRALTAHEMYTVLMDYYKERIKKDPGA